MKRPDWKLWVKDKKECKLWLDQYMKKKILTKSGDESKLHLRKADHKSSSHFSNATIVSYGSGNMLGNNKRGEV